MALGSRHYKILEAVRSSIILDTDITDAIPADDWRIQKQPWHRTQTWAVGGTIAPTRRRPVPHENAVNKLIVPCVVAVVYPSEGSVTDQQEARMQVIERVEDLFSFQGRTKCPPPMLALDTAFTDSNKFSFEQTSVDPGDLFIDFALQKGFDAMATVVNVDIVYQKNDYSSLGA